MTAYKDLTVVFEIAGVNMDNELSNDILLFIKVIDTGSFVCAGNTLGISKASVSRRIKRLEGALGNQLIKRSTRSLSLTEAGQIFYQSCSSISNTIDDAVHKLIDYKNKPAGKLKVGISAPFANDYSAMKLIADFMLSFKAISIECHAVTASDNIDIINSSYDILLTNNDLTDSRVKSTLLHEYPVVICASPSYMHQKKKIKVITDLSAHNCLFHCTDNTLFNEWDYSHNGNLKTIKVKGRLQASRSHMLSKMARAGLGVALLPLFMVDKYISNGELLVFLDDIKFSPAQVFITTFRNITHPKKLNYFVNYLQKGFLNFQR